MQISSASIGTGSCSCPYKVEKMFLHITLYVCCATKDDHEEASANMNFLVTIEKVGEGSTHCVTFTLFLGLNCTDLQRLQ